MLLDGKKVKPGVSGELKNQGAVLSADKQKQLAERLHAGLKGRVITASDKEYDKTRQVFAGGVDRRPALIARAANTTDVATVISAARENGMELAVRSGGHSSAGHSAVEGGIVLDLRDLKGFDIDVKARTVWAGSGLTAGEYTRLAGEHGLATGFGDTASVGIGGITLGGGVGYFLRKYGLTIDSLLAADIVTADGKVLRVDEHSHPDLFWAIRGGGGNFGVVTRFHFRLEPVDRILGGMLVLPVTPQTIADFVDAANSAPEEISTIANIMPAPPMPFLPPEIHGKLVILAMLAYLGDPAAGEKAMAPFHKIAAPLADMLRPMKYPEMYPPDAEDYHPTAITRGMFLKHVDLDTARTIVDHLQASDAPMRVTQLRVMGGAMARVPAEATAYAHRSSKIMANLAAFYTGPEDRVRKETWAAGFSTAIHQGDCGTYVNFLGDEGEGRIHDAYPGSTWERLAAVKAKYDPDNLFHMNQNIPPVAEKIQ